MKKCSRPVHQSLTELNITPLLDLAFVLLVIFILTTTTVADDIPIKMPSASKSKKDPPHSVTYITVRKDGAVYVDNKHMEDMPALHAWLVDLRMKDTNLSVIVRGDAKTQYRQVRAVLDQCQKSALVKVDLATEVADKK